MFKAYRLFRILPMFKRMVIFGVLFATTPVVAEDVTCVFSASKINSLKGQVDTKPRSFADCDVYTFWATGSGANRVYHHFNNSPGKTDANGVCNYKFAKDATYYLYFSGKTLSTDELAKLTEGRSNLLIPLLVSATQPSTTKFNAQADSGKLTCELTYSLPLYISRLQKIEAELPMVASTDILTKLRKLSYDDAKWDLLIPRTDITPFYSYDKTTGVIAANEIPVPMAESVSYIYQRDPGNSQRFLIMGGDRVREEIFDYIGTSDGSVVQIGHLLTGIESQLYSSNTEMYVSFATWSGDLGQAAWEAIKISGGEEPTPEDWKKAWQKKARYSEIAGDIVGAAQSVVASNALKQGAALSTVVEDLFPANWREKNIQGFLDRYEMGSLESPNEASVTKMRDWIDKAAIAFSLGAWELIPNAAAKASAVARAHAHAIVVLFKMKEGPVPPPDPT